MGSLYFYDDRKLDTARVSSFLCEKCLNEILPQNIETCFGVGAVNLATRKIQIFEENISGFSLDDFFVGCNLKEADRDSCWMDLLIFFCPVRYEKEP